VIGVDGLPERVAAVGDVPVVRRMELGDVDPVVAIERISSPDPWTPGILHDELHAEGRRYHVATILGGVVGFTGMLTQVGEGHVTNIAVAPSFRGRRIAAHLLLRGVQWALEQHVGALTLEVRVGNEPAIRLYRRFGFAPVGTRPKYYPNGDDALILWAHDVDSADYAMRLQSIETWLAARRMDEDLAGDPSISGRTLSP
jgi:ribosomal-protein-alanine N-acetyltransferase